MRSCSSAARAARRARPPTFRASVLVPDVGVLDELLGDGRAALDDRLMPDVRPRCPSDAVKVDAVVLEEALILDRDDGLPHDRGDVLGGDEDPALISSQDGEDPLTVRGVDHGVDVRAPICRIERRDLACDRPDRPKVNEIPESTKSAQSNAARRRLRTRRRRGDVLLLELAEVKCRGVTRLRRRRSESSSARRPARPRW